MELIWSFTCRVSCVPKKGVVVESNTISGRRAGWMDEFANPVFRSFMEAWARKLAKLERQAPEPMASDSWEYQES